MVALTKPEPAGVPEQAAGLLDRAMAYASALVCRTAEDAQRALEQGRTAKAMGDALDVEAKRLEREKKRWTVPRAAAYRIAELFRDAALAWQRADQERAIAALPAATTPAERTEAVAALTTKTVKTFKHYSARVVDESRVPRPFWRIDQAALDALARSQKDAFAVDGCELVIEERGSY